MNVVYLVYELINSGPENVLYDICAYMDRKKYNPIVVTLRSEVDAKTTEPKFQDLGVEIRHLSFSTLQLELKTAWVAKRIEDSLKDVGEYIVHAHGHHPTLIASHFKHPSVCTIHCISGEDYVLKKGKILGSYMSWRFRHDLSGIDYPIAISDYMSDYYKNCTKNSLTTIYNGVGAKPSFENKEDIRRRISLINDKYVISVIGSVIPRKNTIYIIEQLKQSKDRDFICLVIGSGSDLDSCKKLAEGDTRFRFEGFKSNVLDYLNVSNLSITASYSEGLPLSVLEAMNVGVPMLMSDIPPHKEIEKVMQIDSVKTFSLANNELLSAFNIMKRQSFDITALQKRANELFSANTMAGKYEKIYESLNKGD